MAEAMADELEDDRLDDGAIEIDSDDKFHRYLLSKNGAFQLHSSSP